MSFSPETIDKIAHLARLGLEHTREGNLVQDNLNKIVKMIDQVQAIDTDGIEPLSHPIVTTLPQRTDQVTEPNQREVMLSLAPQTEAGLYLVPQVIE